MITFDCRLDRSDFALDVAFESTVGITALFGSSGSGKSTVLRIIAGLERPRDGKIRIDDQVLLDSEKAICLPVHRRRVGFVFQDSQLFPHLSVHANLTYGRFFCPKGKRVVGFDSVVEVLGIGHLLDRRPVTLSGGERQRVAIGRALIASPRVMLMDEPLASLDEQRKLEILPFIERLRDEFHVPIIYVSHAVEEVARLASYVVRISAGKVVASGAPEEILAPSMLRQGPERFHDVSFLNAKVSRYDEEGGVSVLDHPAGELMVAARLPVGVNVRLAIQATDVTLALEPIGGLSVRTALKCFIEKVEMDHGPLALITMTPTGGGKLFAYTSRRSAVDLKLAPNRQVWALIKAVAVDERTVAGVPNGHYQTW